MIGGSPPLASDAFQGIPSLYVSVIPTMAQTTFPAIARDGSLHLCVITGAEPTDWNAVVVSAKYKKRNLRRKEKSPPCAPKSK
jgi:hypothetical protein